MKKVLITGVSGFIGSQVAKELKGNYDIIGIDQVNAWHDYCTTQYIFDIVNDQLLDGVFHDHSIDYVIHIAAEKSLRVCEEDKQRAYQINFLASKYLYELTKKHNGKFIFLSSDQVFDGRLGHYHEFAPLNPINYYGKLKQEFEQLLVKDKAAAICRTALVFGDIPHNQLPFFDEIKESHLLVVQGYIVQHVIHRLRNHKPIILPQDEYMTPTSVELLAKQLKAVIDWDLGGILHCCGGERISRYQFGLKIAELFELDPSFIRSHSSQDPLRPKDVSLLFQHSEEQLNMRYPTLVEMLEPMKEKQYIQQ